MLFCPPEEKICSAKKRRRTPSLFHLSENPPRLYGTASPTPRFYRRSALRSIHSLACDVAVFIVIGFF